VRNIIGLILSLDVIYENNLNSLAATIHKINVMRATKAKMQCTPVED